MSLSKLVDLKDTTSQIESFYQVSISYICQLLVKERPSVGTYRGVCRLVKGNLSVGKGFLSVGKGTFIKSAKDFKLIS